MWIPITDRFLTLTHVWLSPFRHHWTSKVTLLPLLHSYSCMTFSSIFALATATHSLVGLCMDYALKLLERVRKKSTKLFCFFMDWGNLNANVHWANILISHDDTIGTVNFVQPLTPSQRNPVTLSCTGRTNEPWEADWVSLCSHKIHSERVSHHFYDDMCAGESRGRFLSFTVHRQYLPSKVWM